MNLGFPHGVWKSNEKFILFVPISERGRWIRGAHSYVLLVVQHMLEADLVFSY
jgi:hypothetical protein